MMAFSVRRRPSLRDRLAAIIMEEYKVCGSYDRLAREIGNANHNKRKVDRRKLRRIAEGDSVTMTLDELEAIDAYLIREGRGLAAVFGQPSIIKSLVEEGRVTFLLGSRAYEKRRTIELSGWDFRSMGTLMRSSYRATLAVRTAVEEVLLWSGKDNLNAETYHDLFEGEPWMSLLEDTDGPSLVCIGSPRACHSTELVLAKMLEVTPFQRPDSSTLDRLPFFFVWPQAQCDELPSAFALPETALPNSGQESVSQDSRTPGLYCYKSLHRIDRTDRTDKVTNSTYGVIAAQRRRTGQVWLVVTGLNGPGTLATAGAVDSITTAIPQGEPGKHGRVLWAIVKGDVKSSHALRGDLRHLTNQQLLSEPSVWPMATAGAS
jgi:hypothetical protein